MIAPFVLWRVMAWIGGRLCWLRPEGRKGELRSRDKRAAGCGGCEAQNSSASRAIHFIALLARRFVFPAIPPFLQPSPVGNDIFQ
jgi:hypothetical protein